VLTLSVGDVQLRRPVELDFKWIGEDASILRCVDEADEYFIALLEDDVLPQLLYGYRLGVRGLDSADDSEGVGETGAFQGVLCEKLVGFGGVEVCETLNFSPVLPVVVVDVEVDQLGELCLCQRVFLGEKREGGYPQRKQNWRQKRTHSTIASTQRPPHSFRSSEASLRGWSHNP